MEQIDMVKSRMDRLERMIETLISANQSQLGAAGALPQTRVASDAEPDSLPHIQQDFDVPALPIPRPSGSTAGTPSNVMTAANTHRALGPNAAAQSQSCTLDGQVPYMLHEHRASPRETERFQVCL